MGCGSRAKFNTDPVQISTRKPREERPKPEPPKAKKLIDYHCDKCGYSGVREKHVCEPKPIAWIETRGKTCARCPYAVDDICTLYKSQHPDRDAVISIGIEIPYAACPAGMWPRVELSCTECGSITFDEKGVVRCKSCKHQPPRKVSLPYLARLKPEQPLPATRPNAIITLAVGQRALDVHAITGPQMAAYAERIGADFHAITDDQHPAYPLANKFRLQTLAANYERVLYLDSDVWVRASAPSIFDAFAAGKVWMHADRPHQANYNSFVVNYATIAKQQNVDPIVDYDCFNSGVVLFDREHLAMWSEPPLPAPKQFLTEQIWIEYNLRRQPQPVGKLPTEWNTQWWFADFNSREDAAYFIHLAACPHEERIYRLKRLAFTEGC